MHTIYDVPKGLMDQCYFYTFYHLKEQLPLPFLVGILYKMREKN